MKHYVVYSKKLRDYLLDNGFTESKKPERNIRDSKYLVFFFEDTEYLRDAIWKYINGIL